MTMKILLAEDEEQLSKAYASALRFKGYEVVQVYDGQQAIDKMNEEFFDVLIMDIMMPNKNGIEALKELRETGNKTHIIMLTAMSEIEDKIIGLDSGADDYLTKPISLKELLARLGSLERRLGTFSENILSAGDIKLNLLEQELASNNSVRLSGQETKLMELLMLNMGKELKKVEIYNHIWARDEDKDEGYVYIYISYLRQKLLAIQSKLVILGDEESGFVLLEKEENNVL